MAVFRVDKTRDYTVMSNYHLKDKNLSLKSKGLLSMMLSLPDEWNYTTRGLAAICKEGVDSIGAALKELESAGYMLRRRMRDAKGKIFDTEYIIYERPQKPRIDKPHIGEPDTDEPYTENPYMAKPDTDEPCTENTAQYNTNQTNPKKENTEGLNNHQSIQPSQETSSGRTDRMDEIESYRKLIMSNIEYDSLAIRYGAERIDTVVEIVLETVCSNRDSIHVARDKFPKEAVKSRLLKLNPLSVEYVLDCIDNNATEVTDIKAYLLTSLYNAPVTIDEYYRAKARHALNERGLLNGR